MPTSITLITVSMTTTTPIIPPTIAAIVMSESSADVYLVGVLRPLTYAAAELNAHPGKEPTKPKSNIIELVVHKLEKLW